MRSFAFFALLLCSANIAAQTPAEQIAKLQNDPNIIWIGEFYRDYEDLDNIYEGENINKNSPDTLLDGNILHHHRQRNTVLKIQRNNAAISHNELGNYLWNKIGLPEIKVFADADLSQPLSAEAKLNCLTYKDTIIVFDPETFEESVMPTVHNVEPQSIYAYRLRQLVYYNAKENMYYNLPLSVAPLRCLWNDEGFKIGLTTLFWLPVAASSTPINPSKAPNMPFIKSVQMHFPFAHAKVLKETEKIADVNSIWCESMRKQKDKIFAVGLLSGDSEDNKALLPQEIQQILNDMDTIVAYDPQALEQIEVVNRKPISTLRINQTFGWDDKKKTLTVAIYSIAPVMIKYNEHLKTLYSSPCFYLYPHRRFKTSK